MGLLTVGRVVDRAVELGVLRSGAELDDVRDEPLSYYGEDNAGALLDMVEECGAGVRVHPKVNDLLEGYRDLFGRLSAGSGGAVTVTGVELFDGSDGERIRMLVNGDELVWQVEHQSDRYLDTLMVAEVVDQLAPRDGTDPRVFVEITDGDDGFGFVFADPAVLSVLLRELGVADRS